MGIGCARERGKRLPEKRPAPAEAPAEDLPESQRILTPRRDASQRLVQIGQSYLEVGQTDKAVQTFQEAINVDSENGVAYFYMAKALSRRGSYDDALHLLERAATFLGGEEPWRERVEGLRVEIREMQEGKFTQPEPSKQPEGIYY